MGQSPYRENQIFQHSRALIASASYAPKVNGVNMYEKEEIIEKFKRNPCLKEVLQLYCDGFSAPEIARILNKSPDTVEHQFEKIIEITSAPNMHRAMVICIFYGIIVIGYVGE